MSSNKEYYLKLDIIRIISCIAVLFYHMGYLRGGFLAVCTFFVLSGYLSCISSFKKETFSIIDYYKRRILHIYLPLLIVVFLSIFVVSLFPSINWLNLKPETLSVLFGYNNYWQLSANLDYFARHINSPFMHFWYIAILLQFDLIFPFFFLLLRKLGNKIHKSVPIIFVGVLVILSTGYFTYMSYQDNIMIPYYDTFCRVFSIFFGLFIGLISSYYHHDILKIYQNKFFSSIIFYCYGILLILLFFIVDSTSPFFPIVMIFSTLISSRLIRYGTIFSTNENRLEKVISFFSKISYEIYLVQYPVIFIFQSIDLNNFVKVPLMIIIILFVSILLHFVLSYKKDKKYKKLQFVLGFVMILISIVGLYQFVIAKDHTKEMKLLEEQLKANQQLMAEKQNGYAKKLEDENNKWSQALEEFEMSDEQLSEIVHNLPVVGVGDSVMLGALSSLYDTFPNGYFDAAVSRTDYEAAGILQGIKNRGILGNPIIINLGTNGQCGVTCQNTILQVVEERTVFWVNVTNDYDVHVNEGLNALASNHSNVTIIDWNQISNGHSEYFVADGIHLTGVGMTVYSQTIYDSIYQTYYDYYNHKKEEILNQRQEELDKKIHFYGNEVLINAYNDLEEKFETAEFYTDSDLTFESLKNQLQESIISNTLPKKNVILLDYSFQLSLEDYLEMAHLIEGYQFYVVSLYSDISYPSSQSITFIPFYTEIKSHSNYLMPDKEHLTKKGNKALVKTLYQEIYQNS